MRILTFLIYQGRLQLQYTYISTMSQVKVEESVKVEHKGVNRRKLIQKQKRKTRKQNIRISQVFSQFSQHPRSALGSFMTNKVHQQCDFDMSNQITMGQGRKLKKKLKKLEKNLPDNPQKVFKEMQKYKISLYQGHKKKIFTPVNQLQKRREKRMKKMEQNSKKRKAEILQKQLQRFQ